MTILYGMCIMTWHGVMQPGSWSRNARYDCCRCIERKISWFGHVIIAALGNTDKHHIAVIIIISCPQRRSSIAQLDPPFLRCRLCLCRRVGEIAHDQTYAGLCRKTSKTVVGRCKGMNMVELEWYVKEARRLLDLEKAGQVCCGKYWIWIYGIQDVEIFPAYNQEDTRFQFLTQFITNGLP